MDQSNSNPVEELAHLLRLQKYHKRKRRDLQDRVNKLKVSCEIQKRLIRSQPNLQRTLADCIRTGNKNDFRNAFDAFKDVKGLAADLATGRISTAISDDLLRQELSKHADSQSFLDRISRDSRDQVLRFVSDIVSNEDFLINRLMSLNQRQLENIQLGQHLAIPDNKSVFGHSTPSSSRKGSIPGPGQTESRASSQVWDLCRHDAFALLLDLVGLYPASNGGSVRRRQELTWASVCARMLSENRPGREKFIIAILDGMANEIEPSGKRALETWIQETLQDGHFLLSRSDNPSFRVRSQGITTDVPAESEEAEAFYTSATRKLFALLKDNDRTHIIPSRVLNLCRFTVDKLRDSDTRFRTAPFFFLAHWLFSTFMLDNIITPEARGLMLSDSFPETARHRILRETILKAQKVVFDVSYAWSHTGPIDTALKADVDAIAAIFRPTPDNRSWDQQDARSSDYFLRSLSPADVYTLVQALYPDKRANGITGSLFLNAAISPPVTSSASSVSGLSIFRESVFDDLDHDRLPPIPGNDSNLSTESDVSSRGPTSPGGHVSSSTNDEDSGVRAVTLRSACSEILAVTKADFVNGINNPASESWALLELRDGRVRNIDRIQTFTVEQSEFEIQSDSEHDNGFRNDSDKNSTYLEIRRSLLRLLADPALGGPQSSNVEIRSSDMMLPFPSPRRQHNPFSPSPEPAERSRTNPYRNRSFSLTEIVHAANVTSQSSNSRGSPSRWPSTLSEAFSWAIRQLEQAEDFTKAFGYSQTLSRIKILSSSNPSTESSMLRYFTRDVEQSVTRSRSASAKLEVLASLLEQQNIETESLVRIVASITSRTRIKMWYCTDVRAAAPYSELEKLASAIKTINLPRQLNTKKTEPPPLRHKGTLKPKNLSAVKKGEATLVDVMVTDPIYRVLNKLKDDQVTIAQQWMDKSGIENICVGEERLHRLLCEVAKCLSQLISSDPVASPVLWGSELFQRDRMDGENEALQIEIASNDSRDTYTMISRPSSKGSEFVHSDYPGPLRRKSDFNIATASMNSQDFTSDYLENRSPTLLTRSSTTFWSPTGYRSQSPLSNISPPSRTWSPMHLRQSISRESFQSATKVKGLLSDLRQSVTGLLVSDIMQATYPLGSETDISFFYGVGRDYIAASPSRSLRRVASHDSNFGYGRDGERDRDTRRDSKVPTSSIKDDLAKAATNGRPSSRQKESSKTNGVDKSLFDLDLAKRRLVRRFDLTNGPYEKLKILHDLEMLLSSTSNSNTPSPFHPQTFLLRTRLEPLLLSGQSSTHLHASITHFTALFHDPSTRPEHLFRDLQTIASLLPSETLDETPQGKTFWSATLAALTLKSTATQFIVEAADALISSHTSRGTPSPAPALTPHSDEHPLTRASALLRLAAAQNHPVAQRELATLYLTHPELVPRVLAPMSRVKDVFRASQAAKWARENSDGRKYDAETMCVAFHWMELSAKGGDKLAGGFVSGRE